MKMMRKHPLSPYGWHKLIAEHLCTEYTNIYGLHTAIVRPFSVYGPGLKKQLFWDLFQKTKRTGDLELFGTGKESRDYIHILDFNKAIDYILNKAQMRGDIFNLASGVETTIEDVVQNYFKALGMERRYTFNGHVRPGDPINWRADISRINSLGFKADIPLNTGLQEVAKWINLLPVK